MTITFTPLPMYQASIDRIHIVSDAILKSYHPKACKNDNSEIVMSGRRDEISLVVDSTTFDAFIRIPITRPNILFDHANLDADFSDNGFDSSPFSPADFASMIEEALPSATKVNCVKVDKNTPPRVTFTLNTLDDLLLKQIEKALQASCLEPKASFNL